MVFFCELPSHCTSEKLVEHILWARHNLSSAQLAVTLQGQQISVAQSSDCTRDIICVKSVSFAMLASNSEAQVTVKAA